MIVPGVDSPIRLQESQIVPAADTLSRAFFNDSDFVQMVPDERKRADIMPLIFRGFLRHGVGRGEVFASSPALEGIAIWFPPEAYSIPFWTLARYGGLALLFRMGPVLLWKVRREDVFALRLHRQLAPFPHWYLAILGVAPEFQGKGYASRVVRPMLARLDAIKLPAYVETTTPEYVGLYEHFGFRLLREVTLPGDKTRMWVFLRNAE